MIRNPVTLAPLSQETLAAAQALRVKPFQVVFCGDPAVFMQQPEAGYDPHVILKEGQVVGLFRINTRLHLTHTFARGDTPGISNLLIDAAHQGMGLGTEACRRMADYLPGAAARARGAYLLVHSRNQGALKALTRGGWTDTGTEQARDPAGVQNVLWMPLR